MQWLKSLGKFNFIHADIRNSNDVERAIKQIRPDVIFHLAGQVAMTTSIENPCMDFQINTVGTFNLLEAVRKYASEAVLIYSSTNKVYGDLEWVKYTETDTRYIADNYPAGFPEDIPLDFSSPYGCSKGAADMYILDYSRIYGLNTVVFRHSSMYGSRQFATYNQGWIGWFCMKALEIKKGINEKAFAISGTGKQVRDVLHADDIVKLYFQTFENISVARGNVFNIGGGAENSLSLIELFCLLENELDIKMKYSKLPPRKSDQKVFIAKNEKAKKILSWTPQIDKISGIKSMLKWIDK